MRALIQHVNRVCAELDKTRHAAAESNVEFRLVPLDGADPQSIALIPYGRSPIYLRNGHAHCLALFVAQHYALALGAQRCTNSKQ